MSLQDSMKRIYAYLDSPMAGYSLGRRIPEIRKLIGDLLKDFDLLEKDERVSAGKSLTDRILGTLIFLEAIYIEVPIDFYLFDFVSNCCLLIRNWNDNVAGDEGIRRKVLFTDRIYRNHMTSAELLTHLVKVMDRIKRMESFALPAIELNKSYLSTFGE